MERENALPPGEYALSCGGILRWDDRKEALCGTVIICPGGGYEWLSPREAGPVAAAFREHDWNAAVLYYTVRRWETGEGLGTLPLRQLGEAVKLVKEQEPGQTVVVCGFSAGGHLAASLGVHWKNLGLVRPDALILCYPVISAGGRGHQPSMRNLAGEKDTSFFSLECHVTSDMPPVFLWHTGADPEVPVENSLLMADAMARAGVKFELIVFPRGTHGLSLATPQVEEPEKGRFADSHVARWFGLCLEWLDTLTK